MPTDVFGNGANNSEIRIDTSLFVQKLFLRTNYFESNIEEDVVLKNKLRIKNLPDPISLRKTYSKKYVDNLFNDPSVIKNTAHVDFIDKNLNIVRFVKINAKPALEEQLTLKLYVDHAIYNIVDESSLLRINPDDKLGLNEQDSIVPNSTLTLPKTIIELPTKSYVDSLHDENEKNRTD